MKKIKVQTALFITKLMLCIPAVLGWCGMLYPDLTLNKDTCRVISESGEVLEETDGIECYRKLLWAKPGQIKVKSRLWELLFSKWDL